MTIMQQMNLFNTSSEVAGFKLDYLEVWNWGTFDKKVYHMNLHGNNSLLTGANASGKSCLLYTSILIRCSQLRSFISRCNICYKLITC